MIGVIAGVKPTATLVRCAGLPAYPIETTGARTLTVSSSAGENNQQTAYALTCSACGSSAIAPTPNGFEKGFVAPAQHTRNGAADMVQPIERYSLASAYSGCAEARELARVGTPCIGNTQGMSA